MKYRLLGCIVEAPLVGREMESFNRGCAQE
jgi:hypothetical protein